jgi:hypothetical protein
LFNKNFISFNSYEYGNKLDFIRGCWTVLVQSSNGFCLFCFAVYALGKLMNVKEDESQLSAIARSFFFFMTFKICKVLPLIG